MFTPRLLNSVLVLLCLFFMMPSAAWAGGDDWRPIDPADMALKAPVVEKDADAEAIFWEVKVADEIENKSPRTVLNHYLRIKIFTERGRESQSRIDIPYFGNWNIKDIAARTIKPDGSIVELKKEDVFEPTIVKANGLKLKAKSFALPCVEPGAIVEYRWKEVRIDRLANYLHLQLQREIPVQLVKYHIKPMPYFPYGMRIRSFQTNTSPLTKDKDGFYTTTMTNVPAFHEEARMPPEDSVRPWMLVYYAEDKQITYRYIFPRWLFPASL
jgi:hypothetical protein